MKRSIRGLVLAFLMLSVSVLSLSGASFAGIAIGVGISVRVGPPALPVYAQPLCPGPGYLWTPGYWAWHDVGGYYWVPGTWVVAPVGMLWTPGYWGFAGGLYGWHPGYWGPHVGFYGGINYGFGYTGVGFAGGEWRGREFFYNRAAVNVGNVRNVYNRTVIVNDRHVAFNGPGGIEARPTRDEEAFARERHTEALSSQVEHERAASQNRALFASENHGRPTVAATARPGEFSGRSVNVERAREAGEPNRAPARNEVSREASRESSNEHAIARSEHAEADHSARGPKPDKQERQAQRQEKQSEKRAAKANREQAKAEKHNAREDHR
jgi:WXXGXW repeat (2 copies)